MAGGCKRDCSQSPRRGQRPVATAAAPSTRKPKTTTSKKVMLDVVEGVVVVGESPRLTARTGAKDGLPTPTAPLKRLGAKEGGLLRQRKVTGWAQKWYVRHLPKQHRSK